MVVGQELVAGPQPERLDDRGDAGRRVRDHDEARGIGVEEGRDLLARGIETPFELAGQESNRVRFELGDEACWASRTGWTGAVCAGVGT